MTRRASLPILTAMSLALLLAPARGDEPGPEAKATLERLQGTWKIARMDRNGKPTDAARINGRVLVIEGTKFTDRLREDVLGAGTITLDPAKDPKVIDARFAEGPEDLIGKVVPAIYRFVGEDFEVCAGPPDRPRPKAFASEPDSDQMHIVYTRVK